MRRSSGQPARAASRSWFPTSRCRRPPAPARHGTRKRFHSFPALGISRAAGRGNASCMLGSLRAAWTGRRTSCLKVPTPASGGFTSILDSDRWTSNCHVRIGGKKGGKREILALPLLLYYVCIHLFATQTAACKLRLGHVCSAKLLRNAYYSHMLCCPFLVNDVG